MQEGRSKDRKRQDKAGEGINTERQEVKNKEAERKESEEIKRERTTGRRE
jgi:hypothetical protein